MMSLPAGYGRVARAKRLLRALNFDAAQQQQFFELPDGEHVVLLGRNDERERPALHAGLDGAPAHVVEVPDELTAVGGDAAQQTVHGAQVVVDDVAKPPRAAGPRVRRVDPAARVGSGLRDRCWRP